jgi:hypothetical protein
MKKTRLSVEHYRRGPESGRGGRSGRRVDLEAGISEQTFYGWKAKHVGSEDLLDS